MRAGALGMPTRAPGIQCANQGPLNSACQPGPLEGVQSGIAPAQATSLRRLSALRRVWQGGHTRLSLRFGGNAAALPLLHKKRNPSVTGL